MYTRLLRDASDEDILRLIAVCVPNGKSVKRYRRIGATRVWKRKVAGRMRFHIPLKFGLYFNTYIDNGHLLFDTYNQNIWPVGTYVECEGLQAVRGHHGKAYVPESIKELDLHG